jgi:hypothetical protein
MRVLKGFVSVILGFLLFWSLTILGLALLLKSTILNPGFVTAELNRVNISLLVEEAAKSGGAQGQGQPPKELVAAVVKTVAKIEPELKQQIDVAIYQVYDYVLGKRHDLSLATTLGETVLSRDFVVSVVSNLDMAGLAQQFINQQISGQSPVGSQIGAEVLTGNINQALIRLEPWMKEQAIAAAGPVLDYLLGKTQTLNVAIQVEPALREIKDVARAAFLASPPPELAGLSTAVQEQAFESAFAGFTGNMPSTLVINEQWLGTEAQSKIASGLAQAETRLAQARVYAGYFQTIYAALIGVALLLVLGIVLIHRQVKSAARALGVTLITYGAIEFGGVLVGKSVLAAQMQQFNGSVALRAFLPQLVVDFLGPLQVFTLAVLIAGVALLIVSFVYKPRAASI